MNSTKTRRKLSPSRQWDRYTVLQDLSLSHEGHSEEIPVRPPDISPRGMFINTPNSFPEGTVLKLRFRLTRSNFEVNTRCEVRYCLPGVGIGVEFIDISPDAARAIEQEVRFATSSALRKP
jgi:hypothetical protein